MRAFHFNFAFYWLPLYLKGLKKKSAYFAMKLWNLMDFQNVQEVNLIFNVTDSNGLLEFWVALTFISDFDQIVLKCPLW